MHRIAYPSLMMAMINASFGADVVHASNVLTIRAVQQPTEEIARLIHRIAEPVALPVKEGATLRELIIKQCGDISTAYTDLLKDDPKLSTLRLDEPLEAQEIKLPACLYFSSNPTSPEVIVRSGDTAFDLYRMRTGGGGTQQELAEYFNAPVKSLNDLKLGTKLSAPTLSLPVPLVTRAGSETYVQELRQLNAQQLAFREPGSVQGNIIMGFSSSRDECDSPSEPYDAEAIYQAYMFSKRLAAEESIGVSGGTVELAVVDNGFYGATRTTPKAKAFEGSPFRSKFFKNDDYSTIATTMRSIDTQPINYVYDIPPTLESGHGTHVTGIALGGPSLRPYLDKMGSAPWASVTILNVGRGTGNLVEGAYELLSGKILTDKPYRIVNLSLTHDAKANPSITNIYKVLFREAQTTLFVVAAGNNWAKDVTGSGIIPAGLGGLKNPNVITVAALDGSRKLAKFSNIGAASVDLAAPGCQIKSWIANTEDLVAISGTSQATPAVTNEMTLLLSLAINASPETLKNRSISSGDLLPASERGKTLYEVSANPARALLLFQDYLAVVDGHSQRTFLGSIEKLPIISCRSEHGKEPKDLQDMFSIKRTEGSSYFFGGVGIGTIQRPCLMDFDSTANLYFSATHEVHLDGSIMQLATPLEKPWPLNNVIDLVARTPIERLN